MPKTSIVVPPHLCSSERRHCYLCIANPTSSLFLFLRPWFLLVLTGLLLIRSKLLKSGNTATLLQQSPERAESLRCRDEQAGVNKPFYQFTTYSLGNNVPVCVCSPFQKRQHLKTWINLGACLQLSEHLCCVARSYCGYNVIFVHINNTEMTKF